MPHAHAYCCASLVSCTFFTVTSNKLTVCQSLQTRTLPLHTYGLGKNFGKTQMEKERKSELHGTQYWVKDGLV